MDSDLDALLLRLARGDRSAFNPAFAIIWPSVLRLCHGMLRNDADAADAAQQALEKILVRSTDYDGKRPALPWALAIAGWECRTMIRERARRKESTDDFASATSGLDAEHELAQRELLKAVMEVIGHLSEEDRETLLATFWEGATSVSGPTLRKRRERALRRLRDTLRVLYGLD